MQVTYKSNRLIYTGVTVCLTEMLGDANVYLVEAEWKNFLSIYIALETFWLSLFEQPFIYSRPITINIPFYQWSYSNATEFRGETSDVYFFTEKDAQIDGETKNRTGELEIKTSFRRFNLKEMVIAVYRYLIRGEIMQIAYNKCSACASNLPQQDQHLHGCLMDADTAIDTYFNSVMIDDYEAKCFLFKIRNFLKLPISQHKIDNMVDGYEDFFPKADMLDSLKTNLPKRYEMLFAEIATLN